MFLKSYTIYNAKKEQLTQHPTVFNCAKDGKYFSFCASDPQNAILDNPDMLHDIMIY